MTKELTEEQRKLLAEAEKKIKEITSSSEYSSDHQADLLMEPIANLLLFIAKQIAKNSEQENN